MDLYRLQNQGEIESTGINEIFADRSAIAIIEWAEKLGTLLPSDRIDIRIMSTGEDHRKVIVSNL